MGFKSIPSFIMIFLFVASFSIIEYHVYASSDIQSVKMYNATNKEKNNGFILVESDTEGKKQKIEIPINKIPFQIDSTENNDGKLTSLRIGLKPELVSLYKEIDNDKSKKTVFVYPVFTQVAYEENGFYDYYANKCDSKCLTVTIPSKLTASYATGAMSSLVLTLLNYSFITDIDIDLNPDILQKYDKVILLHNEYVTKKEFDAITNHPNVVYLFPNALYAQVSVNYDKNTLSLVRGHNYPETNIRNGFNWKFDNSKLEYNTQCNDWSFYKIDNGVMLNCYPNYRMLYDESLLRAIKSDHTFLGNPSVGSHELISDNKLLQSYVIKANRVPLWVHHISKWFVSGNISEQEFVDSILYLSKNGIIS